MLTRKTIKRATRQMRLYGEIKSGALEHLSSKVMGYTADRRDWKTATPAGQEPASALPDTVRVWDEERGAYFLRNK